MNGVRAGALYHILRQKESFLKIHAGSPNFFLELCDYMFGAREEPRSLLRRWIKWNERYIRGRNYEPYSLEAIPEGKENEQ